MNRWFTGLLSLQLNKRNPFAFNGGKVRQFDGTTATSRVNQPFALDTDALPMVGVTIAPNGGSLTIKIKGGIPQFDASADSRLWAGIRHGLVQSIFGFNLLPALFTNLHIDRGQPRFFGERLQRTLP